MQEFVEGGPILPDPDQSVNLSAASKSGSNGADMQLVEPLPQDQARAYFRGVLRGLEYLFFQNVVHRGPLLTLLPLHNALALMPVLFVFLPRLRAFPPSFLACRHQTRQHFGYQRGNNQNL